MAKGKKRRSSRGQRTGRAEAREAAREARREERGRAAQRARQARLLRTFGIVVVIVGVAAAVAFLVFRPGPELEGVEEPPDRGRRHTAAARYDTPTPTSGPHNPRPPACGRYDTQLDLDRAVHALEHGAVVIWYRSDLAVELRDPLIDILNRYDSHVIVSPNDEMEDPIVATAWNRLKRYQAPSEDLGEFVDTYRNRGPERVDCDIE